VWEINNKEITSDGSEWPVRLASASMSSFITSTPTPLVLSVDDEVNLEEVFDPEYHHGSSHEELVAAFAAGQRKHFQRMSWQERNNYEEQSRKEREHHLKVLQRHFGTSLMHKATKLMEADSPSGGKSKRKPFAATNTSGTSFNKAAGPHMQQKIIALSPSDESSNEAGRGIKAHRQIRNRVVVVEARACLPVKGRALEAHHVTESKESHHRP